MRPRVPPLTWFRSFEAAARHLSFTSAAAEIGLTQSAVSQQIKALETRLNVVLFRRLPRALALTDEGRRLLPEVEAALDVLSRATARYDLGGVDRVLTVAASVSVIDWLILPHLDQFRATHDACSIRFLSTLWPDDFATSRADVEIRFGSARQVGKGAVPLAGADLIAVATLALWPWGAEEHSAHLARLPKIETVGTSVHWGDVLQEVSPVDQTPADQNMVQADSYGLALRLAQFGQGVALVPRSLAQYAIASGHVVQCGTRSIPAKEGYHLAIADGADATDQVAHAFADWVHGLIEAND